MKKYIPLFFIIFIVSWFLYIIKPALLGELQGTFKSVQVPNEYLKLESFLSSQSSFSRTFWVPTFQRFSFFSSTHPAISSQDLLTTVNNKDIIKYLNKNDAQNNLEELSVKYVIVPYDSQKEIFLKDRRYNEKLHKDVVIGLEKIEWLKRIDGFGKLTVFELSSPKDHFWTPSKTLTFKSKYISPVEYVLDIKNAKKGDLIIFSEKFDSQWFAREENNKFYDWANLISSNPYKLKLNSFILRKDGDYTLSIYYYPQKNVEIGEAIGLVAFVLVLLLIILSHVRKSKSKLIL